VFCLQTIPPQPDLPSPGFEHLAKPAGFSLYARVAARRAIAHGFQPDRKFRFSRRIAVFHWTWSMQV